LETIKQIINPYMLYGLCVLGALGVCLSLPRRGISPQVLGALIASLAGGLLLLGLGATNPGALPNIYFYIFSLVALGAALRVITHPRPVYAALYFVLTVIATAGLFLILSAEFMAFAMIIVYAGAILITYLFVIMLATQSPQEGEVEVLTEYDTAGCPTSRRLRRSSPTRSSPRCPARSNGRSTPRARFPRAAR
jgi:NADH-quinone oxidoreductase subunit J